MTLAAWHTDRIKTFFIALFAFSVLFSVTAVEGAMLGLAAVLLFEQYQRNRLTLIPRAAANQPLFKPWMLYLAAAALAAVLAVHKGKAFSYLPSDGIKYLCFAVLLGVLTAERLELMRKFYTGGAVVSAVIGVSHALKGLASGVDVRASAFAHPVRFGEMMLLALTLALAGILTSHGKRRIPAAAAGLLILAALLLSQTRGAYLGLLTAFAALLVFDAASRKRGLILAAVLLGAAASSAALNPSVRYKVFSISKGARAAFSAFSGRDAADRFHIPDGPINIRIELWKTGLRIFKDRPLTGVGPANVKKVFPGYYKAPLGGQDTWGSLHNLYIQHMAERGAIGLAALLILFVAMLVLALKNLRAERNTYTLWAATALPAWFVMNLTEVSFQHIHTSFAVFMALAASTISVAPKEKRI